MRTSTTTDFSITAALLALALAIGGAGINHPLMQTLLGLAALGAAAYFVVTERSWRFQGHRRLALLLLAIILLLPLLQLVPLPPGVWRSLPGRDLPAEIDSILGWTSWRPHSLDVERTLRSFLVLLPAAAIFIGCLFLPRERQQQLLWVVLAFAVIGSVLGIVQLVSGGRATPYPSGHSGFPIGLFVNRNHQASFLLLAMPVVATVAAIQIARGKPRTPYVVGAISAIVVFAIVVLGTTSRMGFALLPLGLATALLILFRAQWQLALPSLLALGGLALVLIVRGGFERTISRFSSVDDARFDFWIDINWALEQYSLAGSGFGTFIPVFQTAESLDKVERSVLNHAHNDYLEIALEGGALGVIVLLAVLALQVAAAVKLFRSPHSTERQLMAAAAGAGIVILLLGSLVDYPVRMPALGAVFALLCALLLPASGTAPRQAIRAAAERRPGRLRLPVGRYAGLAALAVLALLVVQAGLSSYHLLAQRYAEAASWATWSTRAHEKLSTQALLRGQAQEATSAGFAALRLSPISAPAVRSVALAADLRGDSRRAGQLMVHGAALGWRDPLTQLWVIDTALRSGEPLKAAQRGLALFQQQRFVPTALVLLLRARDRPVIFSTLVESLAARPGWRRPFIEMGSVLPPGDLPAFVELLASLDRAGEGLSPTEVRPFVTHLVSAKQYQAAQRVWSMSRGAQPLLNGGFEEVASDESAGMPASWDVDDRQGGKVTVAEGPFNAGRRALRIVDVQSERAILAQRLLLVPGSYTLSFRTYVRSAPGAVLRWELDCTPGSKTRQDISALPSATWQNRAVTFIVPDQDCPTQKLALKLPIANQPQEIWIDDVRLQQHTINRK